MGAVAEMEDLEALFDQVAAQSSDARDEAQASAVIAAPAQVAAGEDGGGEPADMFHRVGQLTRTLHDALRELGYDRNLENAVQNLPDARDRLNYIATLTGQAAERALSAVERGQEIQKAASDDGARLACGWEKLYAGQMPVEEFKELAAQTRSYFAGAPQRAADTGAQFHEIMMAQDFHDLTGQVINRVVSLAQNLEAQMVSMLLDARPAEPAAGGEEWLTGPAMNAEGRTDVVSSQAQVDDLLESLGF